MNWLDFVLLGIAAISTVAGFARGLTRMVIGCGATILAVLLSLGFYGIPGGFFESLGMTRQLGGFLGFVTIFGLVLLGGAVAAAVAGKILKLVGLSWADRCAGGFLGLARGVAVGVVLVVILMAFPLKTPPKAVRQSVFAPYLAEVGHTVAKFAPKEFSDTYRRSVEYLGLKRK